MANKDKENHTFLLESFSAHENSIESMAVKILDMEANLIIIEKEIISLADTHCLAVVQ